MASQFFSCQPTTEEYWRAIILFGRNVASYKFALAKALLKLKPPAGTLIKLEDLAEPFALHVAEHLQTARQGQFQKSRFLNACKAFNEGKINREALVEQTVRFGFNNVIDAFHVVGRDPVAERFFTDERTQNAGIRLTDRFSMLIEAEQVVDLPLEVEARWRLVETAWELSMPRQLLVVNHDPSSESLFVVDGSRRRRSVTGSRDALNGYQKGRCFYCDCDIHIGDRARLPDVDHFFPHVLKGTDLGFAIDQVWNLVLACRNCNRGANGKFDRVRSIPLLSRLHERNEHLISSHHPLREVLRSQTGGEEHDRQAFLNRFHQRALGHLIHLWDPGRAT